MKIEIDRHILLDLTRHHKEEKRQLHRAELALMRAHEAHAKKEGIIQYLVEKINEIDKGGEKT